MLAKASHPGPLHLRTDQINITWMQFAWTSPLVGRFLQRPSRVKAAPDFSTLGGRITQYQRPSAIPRPLRILAEHSRPLVSAGTVHQSQWCHFRQNENQGGAKTVSMKHKAEHHGEIWSRAGTGVSDTRTWPLPAAPVRETSDF